MKPFSPLCYISHNIKRAVTLILVTATLVICYVGGVYIDSSTQNYMDIYDCSKNFYMFYEMNNDGAVNEFNNACQEIKDSKDIEKVINTRFVTLFVCKNTLGYENWVDTICFEKTDDFEFFKKYVNDIPKDITLEPGEIIITKRIADMFNLKEGDVIVPDENSEKIKAKEPCKIKYIMNINSYRSYCVTNEIKCTIPLAFRKLTNDESKSSIESSIKNMDSLFSGLAQKYQNIYFKGYNKLAEQASDYFDMIYTIYYTICIIVTIVIIIALNALFVGAYEKRKFEFSVYKAIGFSAREIRRKVIGEILIIEILGLIICGIISLLSIFLINVFLLYPAGQWMKYYTNVSLFMTLGCSIAVIIPVILLRLHKIKKYDITEY